MQRFVVVASLVLELAPLDTNVSEKNLSFLRVKAANTPIANISC